METGRWGIPLQLASARPATG